MSSDDRFEEEMRKGFVALRCVDVPDPRDGIRARLQPPRRTRLFPALACAVAVCVFFVFIVRPSERRAAVSVSSVPDRKVVQKPAPAPKPVTVAVTPTPHDTRLNKDLGAGKTDKRVRRKAAQRVSRGDTVAKAHPLNEVDKPCRQFNLTVERLDEPLPYMQNEDPSYQMAADAEVVVVVVHNDDAQGTF